MRDVSDTISAISSASLDLGAAGKTIIRVSGPKAFEVVGDICVSEKKRADTILLKEFSSGRKRLLTPLIVKAAEGLAVEATGYFFAGPDSYTGQDLAEIHLFQSECVAEAVFEKVLDNTRQAEAGEFTLRAYLNGKIDLSQAEAVAAIVATSNRFQLAAAEKLLDGSLRRQIAEVRQGILELISSIEAGIDFSEEQIEIITVEQACAQTDELTKQLADILAGSVRYEETMDMVSAGLAGAPNVGKSSLLNSLLETNRSIVADESGTTRDVLTGVLNLESTRCAVFDCAGLGKIGAGVLDRLANQAAIESLKAASLVLLCIDADRFDVEEAKLLTEQIAPGKIICVLTKCDLVGEDQIAAKLELLRKSICMETQNKSTSARILNQVQDDRSMNCIAVSSKTGFGIDKLKKQIQMHVLAIQSGATEAADKIAINQRHRQTVEKAVETLHEAKENILSQSNEIAVMLLREVFRLLGSVQTEHVDEMVLDRIFSQFCIGK